MIWIGVDAHKAVHEALALGVDGVAGQRRIPNTPPAWSELLAWARQWPERIWAVEGAWSLGRGLAQYLASHGERVHEVNGRWTAARRRGMRTPGKNDRLDARSVATLLREEAGSSLLKVAFPARSDNVAKRGADVRPDTRNRIKRVSGRWSEHALLRAQYERVRELIVPALLSLVPTDREDAEAEAEHR